MRAPYPHGRKSRKDALAKARAMKGSKRLASESESASSSTFATPVATTESRSTTCPADPENENRIPIKLSASKRKLDLTTDFTPQPCDTSQRLIIVDLACLTTLFEPFRCKSCGSRLTI
ncbi:hypothetical protein ElyMa_000184500 [Elysia marginata]|uniref:CxC3 like cysteine cluster domain-containing protein n=1 Tax=Elysia marginata TaxID=1093978 RepID=A0AAV4EV31_9GAST|nr:hypothetical protein ElyMa_000184500 [Elysia marginata]